MKRLIVIPARLESTRLARKLLLRETGKPLIQHTYEAARLIDSEVVVATDSDEIASEVLEFGGRVVMTGEHPTGTDRMGQVAAMSEFADVQVFVDIQGDEPEIDRELVEPAVQMLESGRWGMTTTAVPLHDDDLDNWSCVKVVIGDDGRALHFGRTGVARPCYRHVGVYAYWRDSLLAVCASSRSVGEENHGLEQWRAMTLRIPVGVAVVEGVHPKGIDTQADYAAFVARSNRAQVNP